MREGTALGVGFFALLPQDSLGDYSVFDDPIFDQPTNRPSLIVFFLMPLLISL